MDYQNISCSLYDRIESLAVTGKNVVIKFKDENDEIIEVDGLIKNIFSENKAEYLEINSINIRLDKIISIVEI